MRIFILIILVIGFQHCYSQSSKPFILGQIEEIDSKLLHEKRTLNIYLPENYGRDDTVIFYPVIYLLDGGADEDFVHISGLVQFNSFPWINRVPKSIVVGVANTDRKRDLSFPTTVKTEKEKYPTTGGSAQFINFIEQELIPYIDKKYTTNKTRTLIGESLGGLFATQVLSEKPGLFNKYIIISPSLWWDNGSILQKQFHLSQPTDIYIAVGKEGLAPTEQPHIMEEEVKLLAEKIKSTQPKTIKVWFDYLPDETHATIGHQAVLNAFKVIYAHKD